MLGQVDLDRPRRERLEDAVVDQVAVLIDFENLVIGARESLPGHANPVPYAAIELVCRELGNAAVRRAYADWAKSQFNRYQQDLALNGVDLIHITRFGVQQKNAADVRMAVDAMELLITHPDVNVFIPVAGDGDYSPLVQRLREFGKHVVGVGTEAAASRRLVSVCSEYKYWGTLVAEVEGTADPRVRAAVDAEFNVESATRLLTSTLQTMNQPVLASSLKHKMLASDPSFDERNYGFRNFRDFVGAMAHVVSLVGDDRDIAVTLREGTALSASPPDRAGSASSAVDRTPPLLQILHSRWSDMPQKPETRDALLSSVHDAWRDGKLATVADISDVLFDEETGLVPNKWTRQGLSQALAYWHKAVMPLIDDPDADSMQLRDRRIADFDGSECATWTRQGHIAWLTWIMFRIRFERDLDRRMVDTFFADSEDYGRELVTEAREVLDDRIRQRAASMQ